MAIAGAFVWSNAVLVGRPAEMIVPSPETAKTNGVTYYLIQRISVETDAGVRGVEIGTVATLVKKGKSGMKIRLPDGVETIVTPQQLTQDAALAEQLAEQERQQAAAVAEEARARAEARLAAGDTRREKEAAAAQDYVRRAEINASPSPPATPRPWGLIGSALDEKPRVVARVRKSKKGGK
jgi:hypothetical protein